MYKVWKAVAFWKYIFIARLFLEFSFLFSVHSSYKILKVSEKLCVIRFIMTNQKKVVAIIFQYFILRCISCYVIVIISCSC